MNVSTIIFLTVFITLYSYNLIIGLNMFLFLSFSEIEIGQFSNFLTNLVFYL